MPRVTVAHEQVVRQRIIAAAINVLGEVGIQRATIQDVVRESGLSVGAVYTHFKNKQELFLAACACQVDHEKADLQRRMAELGSVSDRLRAVVDFAVEISVMGAGDNIRAHAWMAAEDSPEMRQILRDRRTEMTAPRYVSTMKAYGDAFSIQSVRCGSLTRVITSLMSTAKMNPKPPPKAPYSR